MVEPLVGLLDLAGFSPFQGGDKVSLVWESLLFGFGKLVVGVGSYRHGGRGAAQAVADATVVLGVADQDADGFVVVFPAQQVIDESDVEVEFAGVLGLEFSGLEFDDHIAELFDMEEEQIDVIVIAVDV